MREQAERGSILILSALLMTALFGVAALAVDASFLMEVHSEVQNAADASALAGASGLVLSPIEARRRAADYADKNPTMGQAIRLNQSKVVLGQWDFATSRFITPSAAPNSVRVTIQLDPGSSPPTPQLFFAPVIGFRQVNVAATATASLSSRNLMLILDRSGSMDDDTILPSPPNPLQPLTDMKTAAKRFLTLVQNFPITGDQAGLVYYSSVATLDQRLTSQFNQVSQAIDLPTANGCTNIAGGLQSGRRELTSARANNRGLKVAILLSDGKTNTLIGGPPCQYLTAPPGNPAEQQAFSEAQRMANVGIVLYTISLGLDTNQNLMKSMALVTGGEHFFAPTVKQLDGIFDQISARIPVVLVE